MSLGEKIRQLRRDRDWSQGQLGIKLGIHEKHLSRYENNKSVPSAPMLRKIAEVFGVTVDYLLANGGKGDSPVAANIRDVELLECFLEADKLSEENRAVIKKMVRAFVIQNTVENLAKK